MFLSAFLMQHGVGDHKDKQSQELQLFPKLRSNHGIEVKHVKKQLLEYSLLKSNE
jgi:hypothetical protein